MANTFKSVTKANISTSLTTVYTVPGATTTIIIGFGLSNRTTSDLTVDVLFVKNGGDTIFLANDLNIPPGNLFDFNAGNKIIAQAGDYIRIQSSISNGVDVILSLLEQT